MSKHADPEADKFFFGADDAPVYLVTISLERSEYFYYNTSSTIFRF